VCVVTPLQKKIGFLFEHRNGGLKEVEVARGRKGNQKKRGGLSKNRKHPGKKRWRR